MRKILLLVVGISLAFGMLMTGCRNADTDGKKMAISPSQPIETLADVDPDLDADPVDHKDVRQAEQVLAQEQRLEAVEKQLIAQLNLEDSESEDDLNQMALSVQEIPDEEGSAVRSALQEGQFGVTSSPQVVMNEEKPSSVEIWSKEKVNPAPVPVEQDDSILTMQPAAPELADDEVVVGTATIDEAMLVPLAEATETDMVAAKPAFLPREAPSITITPLVEETAEPVVSTGWVESAELPNLPEKEEPKALPVEMPEKPKEEPAIADTSGTEAVDLLGVSELDRLIAMVDREAKEAETLSTPQETPVIGEPPVDGAEELQAPKVEEETPAPEAEIKAEENRTVPEEPNPARERLDAVILQEKIIAEGRQKEARAKYAAGMKLYRNHMYEEALLAFEEALQFEPDHKDARFQAQRCRGMLGNPGKVTADQLIQSIAEREVADRTGIELQLRTDLEKAQELYLKATTADPIRAQMPFEEQIAEAMGQLKQATDKLRQVDTLLGSSPLTTAIQKDLRLQVEALRAQIADAQKGLRDTRDTAERKKAREDSLASKQVAENIHRERMAKLLGSAQFFFEHKHYDKARAMCNELLKMDPNNQEILDLRKRVRAAAHEKEERDIERDMYDAKANWSLDVEKSFILPDEDVLYPDDWEQIKGRARQHRTMSAGTIVEREIRNKLESQRISVEYVDQPMRDVLAELQERSNINIVADSTVPEDATVTLTVNDMTLVRVMDWIMRLTELNYEVKNEAIYVSEKPQRKVMLQIYPVQDLTRIMRDYYPPELGDDDDDDEEEELDETDLSDIVDRIREVIQGFDEEGASLEVWEDNLIVMQTPEVHAQLLAYLNRLREFSKQQVLVETRFLSVTDNLREEIGVSWSDGRTDLPASPGLNGDQITPLYGANSSLAAADLPAQQLDTLSNNSTVNSAYGVRSYNTDNGRWLDAGASILPGKGAGGGSGLQLNLGYIMSEPLRQFEANAVLHALKESNRASVLHNPRLLVANGKNAYCNVLTRTNYVAGYTQQGQIYQPEVNDFEQGVTFTVRPVISYDRKYITIRLRPRLMRYDVANSRAYDYVFIGQLTEAIDVITLPVELPVVEVSELESNVTIPDQGTILLGGLIQDNRRENFSGVPILSSIPYLGRAFRNENRSYNKSNLIMMVSGKIIELD